jgi:hypothetical protein
VKMRHGQQGITLVMSLIMLIVLTLLVVSAIRFGNINLKIAGNAQVEAEASAATQVAIERMILEVSAATNVDTVAAQPSMVVSTGGGTYTVNVSKPVCNLSRNIMTTELDPSNTNDRACFENPDADRPFDKDGKPIAGPTACKDQQWDVAAAYSDASSGANVSMLQGVALRVGAQVKCP